MNIRELVTRIGFRVDDRGLAIYDRAIGRVYKQTDQLYNNLMRVAQGVEGFGRGMTLKLSLPLSIYSGFAVKAAGDTERFIDRYSTLLGSADAGRALFADIKNFEPFTPLTLNNLTEGTNLLLGVGGMAKEKVLPTLRMLSDIAGADGQRFNTLALNYAQILSNQRLMGEDARRFGEAGINLYAELAKRTGKTTAELRKMGEQGEITGDQVTSVLQDMTAEGGRFYKGSENASKTLPGLFSTISSAVDQLNVAIGQLIVEELKLKPIFTWLGAQIPKVKNFIEKLPKPLRTMVAVLGLMAIVLPPLIWAIGHLGVAFIGAQVAMLAFQMTMGITLPAAIGRAAMAIKAFTVALVTNPWTLVIIAAIAALWLFIDDFIVWMHGGNSVLGLMFGDFPSAVAKVKATLKAIGDNFGKFFADIKQYYSGLINIIAGVFKVVFGFLYGDFDLMIRGFKDIMGGFVDALTSMLRIPFDFVMGIINNTKGLWDWLHRNDVAPAPNGFVGNYAPGELGLGMLTPAQASTTSTNMGNVTVKNNVAVTPPVGTSPQATGTAVAAAVDDQTRRTIDDLFGFVRE